jgi:hypothetical protein
MPHPPILPGDSFTSKRKYFRGLGRASGIVGGAAAE